MQAPRPYRVGVWVDEEDHGVYGRARRKNFRQRRTKPPLHGLKSVQSTWVHNTVHPHKFLGTIAAKMET
jgi:hypothetical protein